MIILLDFDSTLVDSSKAFYDYYVEQTGDNLTSYDESKIDWSMRKLCPLYTQEQADNVYIQPGFFKYLRLYPNAYEVLTKLKEEDHFLHIVSCHKPQGMAYKMQWIKKNLPMIDEVTLIPIAHGNVKFDKSSVKGDILVDDSLSALKSASTKFKLCYGFYAWNKEWQGDRVLNWNEVYDYIKRLGDNLG